MKFVATKKGIRTNLVHPSLLFLFLDPGSGMGKNQDPGSGINIPDPQHCARCGKYDADPTGRYSDSDHRKVWNSSLLACVIAQSRLSTRLFLQSSELGPSHPLTCRRVWPLLLWFWGGNTISNDYEKGSGGGVPTGMRGQTLLWHSRYFVPHRFCS